MKKFVFVLLSCICLASAEAQCSLSVNITQDCDSSCSGKYIASMTGHKPILYSHGTNYFTFSSPNPDPIQTFHAGLTDLCAGDYYFHMLDSLGCSIDTIISISAYNFEAELIVTMPNTGNNCDGILTAVPVTGGIEPFQIFYSSCDSGGFDPFTNGFCPGNYQAIIQDAVGCEVTTNCVNTEYLSINNEDNTDWFQINNSSIQIKQPYKGLNIYGLSGQQVLETTEHTIDLTELPSGIYILSILTLDGSLINKKFHLQ